MRACLVEPFNSRLMSMYIMHLKYAKRPWCEITVMSGTEFSFLF